MDIRLRRHLDTARGTISAGAAARLGLGPHDLRALCAAGVLVHVARGPGRMRSGPSKGCRR